MVGARQRDDGVALAVHLYADGYQRLMRLADIYVYGLAGQIVDVDVHV